MQHNWELIQIVPWHLLEKKDFIYKDFTKSEDLILQAI
jgi:hypothetical protein